MKSIIVVEDDIGIQDAITRVFERKGYKVTVFFNGDSIIAGDYDLPDLFILDKQLSGIDGLDICDYIKRMDITRNIPVIMLSANPHITRLAKSAGADDALEKPFKIKDIRTMVEKYI